MIKYYGLQRIASSSTIRITDSPIATVNLSISPLLQRRPFSVFSNNKRYYYTKTPNDQNQLSSSSKESLQDDCNHNNHDDKRGNILDSYLSTATKNQIQAIWTQSQSIPNQITLARICSTPFLCHFITTNQYKLAVTGCILAGISDVLDGYIARNYNQKTILGTYLDPLADKIFINSIALSLSYASILPVWCTSLWLGRDVLLIGMAYRTAAIATQGSGNNVADPSSTPLKIKPSTVSKVNTLFQFVTIWTGLGCMAVGYDVVFLPVVSMGEMSWSPMESLCVVTCGTTISSGLGYMDGKAMAKRTDHNRGVIREVGEKNEKK